MRGKATIAAVIFGGVGITPAHAGKSACAANARGGLKDHPRTCGEKTVCVSKPESEKGSPPHMRGKGKILDARP